MVLFQLDKTGKFVLSSTVYGQKWHPQIFTSTHEQTHTASPQVHQAHL